MLAASGAAVSGLVGGCKEGGSKAIIPDPPPTIARTGVTRAGQRPDLSSAAERSATDVGRSSAGVRVEVRPLGSVPFDALTLPVLASAGIGDGTEPDVWIATQHGATPPWPVLLADGTPESRRVPGNLRISAFRVVRSAGAMRAVEWERPLPRGLILGRSADEQGFLVEWPREDGTRWIGKAAWETGDVEWLVDGAGQAAFATLGPGGELAYSRRTARGRPWEMVVRSRASDEESERALASPAGDSLVFPTFSADRERVYVMNVAAVAGVLPRMLAVDLAGTDPEPRVAAFATLNFEPSIGAAWQSTMCVATPWGADVSGPLSTGLAFLSLESGSMAWMDGATGGVRALARGTVGAAAWCGVGASEGLVLGSAQELVHQSVEASPSGGVGRIGTEGVVVRGGFVPRLRWSGAAGVCGVVLVSPAVGGPATEVGVFEVVGGVASK